MGERELQRVRDLLAEAGDLRRFYRRQRFGRGEDVADLIAELEHGRKPLTSYCRRGPQLGRLLSNDPARVLNREATAELRRLRSLLRPRTGAPRPKAKTYTAKAMRASLARAIGEADALTREHEAMRAALASGTPRTGRHGNVYRSTADLQEEARVFVARLDRARQLLNRAWQRYERAAKARLAAARVATRDDAETPSNVRDEWEVLRDRVTDARERFRDLRAELVRTSRQTVPDAPPVEAGGKWTLERAMFAYSEFERRHGRFPRKGDHKPENGLPHYTQLRRDIGNAPRGRVVESLLAQRT